LYSSGVSAGLLRIGELSRRSGVSPELLRAWERRYGLLTPERSTGGLRLYSADDVVRVQAMQQHLAAGVAAAEAAALARRAADPAGERAVAPEAARSDLETALSSFDEGAAHAVIDALLAQASLDVLLRDVVVPYLHALGEGWERGDVSIAQEHFASSLLRGRLLGLARGWGSGFGPAVLLACAPGEQHDLGLIAFGLALRARGWSILYLGADTPVESVADAARIARPELVVLSSVDDHRFRERSEELVELAREHHLFLAGAGSTELALDEDVRRLTGGPVEEAASLTHARVTG
jgi:MerR family transcriptional regulator, light-induced transcriptional regulator